jgi:hypothetical protein
MMPEHHWLISVIQVFATQNHQSEFMQHAQAHTLHLHHSWTELSKNTMDMDQKLNIKVVGIPINALLKTLTQKTNIANLLESELPEILKESHSELSFLKNKENKLKVMLKPHSPPSKEILRELTTLWKP